MMRENKIVIITDPNRQVLRLCYTENIEELLESFKETNERFTTSDLGKINFRVVYQESFSNKLLAISRYESMKHFTRMQLEKVVRKENPNWLNLYPTDKTKIFLARWNGNHRKALA